MTEGIITKIVKAMEVYFDKSKYCRKLFYHKLFSFLFLSNQGDKNQEAWGGVGWGWVGMVRNLHFINLPPLCVRVCVCVCLCVCVCVCVCVYIYIYIYIVRRDYILILI